VETADDNLRVVVISGVCDPSEVPPAAEAQARALWEEELTDDIWSECCRHGEVERIAIFAGLAAADADTRVAVRFQTLSAATSAVDALDGRFFAERTLHADFDDGSFAKLLPATEDRDRQERFGFGEIAQAVQDSIKVLKLAAAEGAPFIACAQFLIAVEHYDYSDGSNGEPAGYVRRSDAPPPDVLEQSRAILQQACDAGAAFINCEEYICELPLYDWREGPEGVGYYRHAAAPPAADPREQTRLLLREAAAAGADFVKCPEDVGDVVGYDFLDGEDGLGYYRRPDAPPPDGREYSRIVLQRASAAGASFVGCPEYVMALPGYDFRDGPEGTGYYLIEALQDGAAPASEAAPEGTASYDAFMETMRDLGAM